MEIGTILPRGEHSFPFEFVLPSDIPSTFNGCEGALKYYLEASLIWMDKSRSTLVLDPVECFELISIVSQIDLNENDALKVKISNKIP